MVTEKGRKKTRCRGQLMKMMVSRTQFSCQYVAISTSLGAVDFLHDLLASAQLIF